MGPIDPILQRVLLARLTSNVFYCPICARDPEKRAGRIRLEFDTEHDDCGYPVSSTPVFFGECEDSVTLWPLVDDDPLPRNHAAQLNKYIEVGDGYYNPDVNWILGQARERATSRAMLNLVTH